MSLATVRTKSIIGCEIGHSRAAPVETKPLLRKQNDCSAAASQLKNRVRDLNNSPIQRRRRFGQATTSRLDVLNSVSVP
jgi:hypothetical protein